MSHPIRIVTAVNSNDAKGDETVETPAFRAAAWIDVQSDKDNKEGLIFDIPQQTILTSVVPKNDPCVVDPW